MSRTQNGRPAHSTKARERESTVSADGTHRMLMLLVRTHGIAGSQAGRTQTWGSSPMNWPTACRLRNDG